MANYVFAPAGEIMLRRDLLQKCIEYIGTKQRGFGSPFAKGKRYIKNACGCSSASIKRAVKAYPKIINHDFETKGIEVFYYHKDYCVNIVAEAILFVLKAPSSDLKLIFGRVPNKEEFLGLVFAYRLSQLRTVVSEDYKGQGEAAARLVEEFNTLHF